MKYRGGQQYSGQDPNQYPEQYPSQYPEQYPSQYPEQDPGQYQVDPSQYPGQDPSQDPSQYPGQDPGQGEEPSNEDENKHPGIIGPAIKVAKNLANNAASIAFSGINSLTGVNIEDKVSTNNALEKAYETLSDPETKENIKRVLGEGSQVAAIALEASGPAINKFMEKTTDALEKSANKLGEAAVSVALNTAASVPGVGAVVGAVRSADKGAQAMQSVFNAFSDTATAAGDTANEIKNKFNSAQEQMNGMQAQMNGMANLGSQINNMQIQTAGSIAEFKDATLNPEKFKTNISKVTRRKKTFFRNTKSRQTRK